MNANDSDSAHKVYNNDPVSLKSYVNKSMLIKTRDGRDHTGVVYTVDPVSESFILINPIDEPNMKIIMGDAVEGIEILTETAIQIPDSFISPATDLPESTILQRKNAVKDLLLENRFPVTEDDNVLNIEGIVSIESPYDQEHCISTNEIVLQRIQQLVSSVVI